jgi:hypothetical protein
VNNCRNCHWWGRRRDGSYDRNDFSRCGRVPHDERSEPYKSDAEAAEDAAYWEEPVSPLRRELAMLSGDCCSFFCRGDFGCVLFEQLEAKP